MTDKRAYNTGKTERLAFRVSPELKKTLKRIATEKNISMSELITSSLKRLFNI